MSVITGAAYKVIMGSYRIFPFKKPLCFVFQKLNIVSDRLYRDFRFEGKFNVKIDKDHSFDLYSHGGTIENETFWKGLFVSWESDTGWIWTQLAKCSDTIFDIGANTGIYSMVAKTVNPKAVVYAFEPSINTYTKLKQNSAINGFDVHCMQIALSNTDQDQTFYDVANSNQTSASLSPDMLKNKEASKGENLIEYNVKSMKLSSFIQENNIKGIDLIKMDIEMHEPEAVEGLGEYLDLYKPIIVIEVLSDKVADRLNSLIGKDFIKFHLSAENSAELVDKFSVVPQKWNYLVFHKDMESKIRKNTTLNW